MSSVKISELPAVTSVYDNDVIIVNSTNSNTTSQCTIGNLFGRRANNITLTPPAGLSVTLNDAETTLSLVPINVFSHYWRISKESSLTVLTNTTNNPIQLSFTLNGANASLGSTSQTAYILNKENMTTVSPVVSQPFAVVSGSTLTLSGITATGNITPYSLSANTSITLVNIPWFDAYLTVNT